MIATYLNTIVFLYNDPDDGRYIIKVNYIFWLIVHCIDIILCTVSRTGLAKLPEGRSIQPSINFKEITSCAHGNFENQNKVLEFSTNY
jgi:hypothetical protein